MGQEPPPHLNASAAERPPKAAAPSRDQGGSDGPSLCEESHGCYDSFFESAVGSDGSQALWKGLTGAKAHFSHPCLTTTWPRTIRFVR